MENGTVLTDSVDSRQYIKRLNQRDPELDSYWGTNCTPVVLLAPDGKRRKGLPYHPRRNNEKTVLYMGW